MEEIEADEILTGRKTPDGEEWHARNAVLSIIGKPLTKEELAGIGTYHRPKPNPMPYIRLADTKNPNPDGMFKALPKNTAVEVGLKWTF